MDDLSTSYPLQIDLRWTQYYNIHIFLVCIVYHYNCYKTFVFCNKESEYFAVLSVTIWHWTTLYASDCEASNYKIFKYLYHTLITLTSISKRSSLTTWIGPWLAMTIGILGAPCKTDITVTLLWKIPLRITYTDVALYRIHANTSKWMYFKNKG